MEAPVWPTGGARLLQDAAARLPRPPREGTGAAPGVICLLTNIVITSILRASKLPLGGHHGHHPQSRQPRPLRSRLAQYLSLVFFRRLQIGRASCRERV